MRDPANLLTTLLVGQSLGLAADWPARLGESTSRTRDAESRLRDRAPSVSTGISGVLVAVHQQG